MTNTIGFYTLVRDEEKRLEPMLEAAAGVGCTDFTIVDTGSVDRTRRLAARFLKTHAGRLVEAPWTDFATVLNVSLEAAREGSGCEYLLQGASGEHFKLHRRLPRLKASAYMIRAEGAVSYWTPRLHRADIEAHYEGSTHPYLRTNGAEALLLPHITFEDVAYDDDREAKLERDRVYLEREVLERPLEPRWAFYLAQTYRCQGRLEQAADWYRRRVEMGGFEEEVFYSMYMEAMLRQNTHLLLKAWEFRPTRAEPLRLLARLYEGDGMTEVGRLFHEAADRIPMPTDLVCVHVDDYKPRPKR